MEATQEARIREIKTWPQGRMRRLSQNDLSALKAHLLRLDERSRYDRFGAIVTDDFLIRHAEHCFTSGAHVVCGSVVAGEVRGTAELHLIRSGLTSFSGGFAEAAFCVETEWRRSGIGTELMTWIISAARNRHIRTLHISCLARNRAMQNLAKKFSAELRFDIDEVTGEVVARAPSPLSLWREWADDYSPIKTPARDLMRRVFTGRNLGRGWLTPSR